MCRLLGYTTTQPIALRDILGPDGLAEFSAMSDHHADGWGMAWYTGSEPQVVKSPNRARDDPEYLRLAASPLGEHGLVHLRWATPGLAVEPANSHPFRHGCYTMAHNGAIHPQHRLDELLPRNWAAERVGTTDSERVFLHILLGLAGNGGDIVAAIAATSARLARDFQASSLNSIFLTPQTMVAISSYDPGKIPVADFRARGYTGPPEDLDGYFDLAYRQSEDGVVVASSGWPQQDWEILPNRHVLLVDRKTFEITIEPIL